MSLTDIWFMTAAFPVALAAATDGALVALLAKKGRAPAEGHLGVH